VRFLHYTHFIYICLLYHVNCILAKFQKEKRSFAHNARSFVFLYCIITFESSNQSQKKNILAKGVHVYILYQKFQKHLYVIDFVETYPNFQLSIQQTFGSLRVRIQVSKMACLQFYNKGFYQYDVKPPLWNATFYIVQIHLQHAIKLVGNQACT